LDQVLKTPAKAGTTKMAILENFCKDWYHWCHQKVQLKSTTPITLVYGRMLVIIGIVWFLVLGIVIPGVMIPVWFDELVYGTSVWTAARFACRTPSECDAFDKVKDVDTREWLFGAEVETDIPKYAERVLFYVWDVQNPRQIVEQGAKPVLAEKGPFGYARITDKMNVAFSPDNELVNYAEAFFYVRLDPRPCELFHAATGVWPVKPCQNDSDIVTVLNVKFLETVHFMTPERIMADILQEWWEERRKELLTDFIASVKYHMLPEVFTRMLDHQKRMRIPMVVDLVMRQIVRQNEELQLAATGVVDTKKSTADMLKMFIDDEEYLETVFEAPFDCGTANVSSFERFPEARTNDWALDLHDVVHTAYLGKLGVVVEGATFIPPSVADGPTAEPAERCLWSTKPAIMALYPRGTTNPGDRTNLLDITQAAVLLGGGVYDVFTGLSTSDPLNLFANPSKNNNAWMKASYGDEAAIQKIGQALCNWGGHNATPGSLSLYKCNNQTRALMEYLYTAEDSWANHSITAESLYYDLSHTVPHKRDALWCGDSLASQSCSIEFSPFLGYKNSKIRNGLAMHFPQFVYDGARTTLSPEIVKHLFTPGNPISLLQLQNQTYWYSAIQWCEQYRSCNYRDQPSECVECEGMRNHSRATSRKRVAGVSLPNQFSLIDDVEFGYQSFEFLQDHYENQICGVASYLQHHIVNSSWVGDTAAQLLNDRFDVLHLNMEDHSHLNRLAYAQFAGGQITRELWNGLESIAGENSPSTQIDSDLCKYLLLSLVTLSALGS
jgi:hypothetical protein